MLSVLLIIVSAAQWSAVAATCSALAALCVLLIQRKNSILSVRPDLIVTDWIVNEQGHGDRLNETLDFKFVKNVGNGLAFNVFVNTSFPERNGTELPRGFAARHIPILSVGEEYEIDYSTSLWWNNIEAPSITNVKEIKIDLTICYQDVNGRIYRVTYQLTALNSPDKSVVVHPRFSIDSRKCVSRPARPWIQFFPKKIRKLLMGQDLTGYTGFSLPNEIKIENK